MSEYNDNVIENIKNRYWGGKSEVTFNVPIDKTFRTVDGLKNQISKIKPPTNPEHDANLGLIYVAIPDDNSVDGVTIAPVAVEREDVTNEE